VPHQAHPVGPGLAMRQRAAHRLAVPGLGTSRPGPAGHAGAAAAGGSDACQGFLEKALPPGEGLGARNGNSSTIVSGRQFRSSRKAYIQ